MKKVILVSLIVFIGLSKVSFAQFIYYTQKEKTLIQFYKTKTLVVLTGDSSIDQHLKDGVTNYWKQTQYEFVPLSDFKKNINNPEYSFLIPIYCTLPNTLYSKKKKKENIYFDGWKVILGKKDNSENIDVRKNKIVSDGLQFLEVIVNAFNNTNIEVSMEDMDYRLTDAIKMMDNAIEKGKLNNERAVIFKLYNDQAVAYNKNKGKLRNKTLLVVVPSMPPSDVKEKDLKDWKKSQEDFENDLKKYPYKLQFVSQDEIADIVKNKNDKYCYLICYYLTANQYRLRDGSIWGPSRIWYILDTKNNDVLYADVLFCLSSLIVTKSNNTICFIKNLISSK